MWSKDTWPSMTGIVCAANNSPAKPTAREATTSTWVRLIGLTCRSGAAETEPSVDIPAVSIELRKNAVFHRATQKIYLRGRRAANLNVFDPDAVEVFASS